MSCPLQSVIYNETVAAAPGALKGTWQKQNRETYCCCCLVGLLQPQRLYKVVLSEQHCSHDHFAGTLQKRSPLKKHFLSFLYVPGTGSREKDNRACITLMGGGW